MKRYGNLFATVASFENLYAAFRNASRTRELQPEVLKFSMNLEENLAALHYELTTQTYRRGKVNQFIVYDPVQRLIMAAPFRERVVDWALYRVLNPLIDKRYISTSYGCRQGKGSHAAVKMLQKFIRLQKSTAYVGKMDIAKYFYRVNHEILLKLYADVIKDKQILWLLSLSVPENLPCGIDLKTGQKIVGVGMPIGSLASQMHANFYLDPLDKFIKHNLKAKYYLRYMDDMCVVSDNKREVRNVIEAARLFAKEKLQLEFNHKTCIRTETQGVDFCGYRVWRTHIRLRKSSALRMKHHIKFMQKNFLAGKISSEQFNSSLQSHFGQLKHGNCLALREKILSEVNLWNTF